jgi:hypothetical protein
MTATRSPVRIWSASQWRIGTTAIGGFDAPGDSASGAAVAFSTKS